jgi:hypothetical protein
MAMHSLPTADLARPRRGLVAAWLTNRATPRFALLVGLGLLSYVSFEFTQWQPRAGELSLPIALLPIRPDVWYTATWLAFGALLWVLLGDQRAPLADADHIGVRRIAVAVVALAFLVEIVSRLTTIGFFGLEGGGQSPRLALLLLGAAVAGAAVLAWTLYRPPGAVVLTALLVAGGLAIRLLWLVVVTPEAQHSDNLFVIRLGLERFVAGQTPYAFFDFTTHANPMPYLPVTFLSYVPPFLLGLNLQTTSYILSLALLPLAWGLMRALAIPPRDRRLVLLALAVFYALPISISLDAQTEFQAFNLALVLTFALVMLNRPRLAAACYGLALAAMPVALYCAGPLLVYAWRTLPRREFVVSAVVTVTTAAVPILAFLLWDAQAFIWSVSYVPREAWGILAERRNVVPYEWPYLFAWHHLGGWLRLVQIGLVILFTWLALTRARDPFGLLVLALGSYLTLTLTSTYVGPHLLQVVLFLIVLAEVARVGAGAASAGRAEGPPDRPQPDLLNPPGTTA